MLNLKPGSVYRTFNALGDRIDYFAFALFLSKTRGIKVSCSYHDGLLNFLNQRYVCSDVYFNHSRVDDTLLYTTENFMDVYLNNLADWPKFDNIKQFDIALPKKYVTEQWDAKQKYRQIDLERIDSIRQWYRDQEYSIITVGGEASDSQYSTDLDFITYIISKADYHIGADSGFQHLAKLILPTDKLHVYINEKWEDPNRGKFDYRNQLGQISISGQARVLFNKGAQKNFCEEL